MNWGFQELGVAELTPDRPALNFEFVRCEKSWLCVGKPPNPRSHAHFQFFCSKSRFWKMNWGFQKLGVSELTPDRPALNFEFVRCEKSCIFEFFRDLGKYKLRGLENFWVFWVFRKNKLRDLAIFWVFWCISSPGTYLERCAVKFWPSLPPRLLILKTKTFPLCKNNEKIEFRSQCKVLCFGI